MTDMNKFYEACCIFNEVAGNDKKLTLKDFANQQGYNMEECKEISDGIAANNAAEIFDGVLDNFVTNMGHLQRLKALGFDIEKGIAAVALNNLSKYIEDGEFDRVEATLQHYALKGVLCYVDFNKKHKLYAIKRKSDDKVMKPVGFVSVVLEQFIPEEILKNGLEA
jgi:hypothetical protein